MAKKLTNYTRLNLLRPFTYTLHLSFIKSLAQLELDGTICKFCAEAEIWKVKTGTLYFSSSNKVGQACRTEHPLLSQTLGSYSCPIWIKTQTVRPCASYFLRSKHNGQSWLGSCTKYWTHEDNMVGELLRCMQCWWGDSSTWPNQHEDASTKLPFISSNGKRSPLTLKTDQGANRQRQQTGRGPWSCCGLGSAFCEPHSHLHTGERNQASALQSAEQGGNEKPDLIPPWAEGSYGLGGQGDLLWILGILSLLLA